MKETAAMRKEAQRINKFRSAYTGRAVLYTLPSGAVVEGKISDLSYTPAQDDFPAFWSVRVAYVSSGMDFNSWTSPKVLEPVGWTA